MSKNFILFIKRLSVFSLIIILISYALSHLILPKYITPAMPFLLLFFYVITLAVYYFIDRASDKKFSKFVTAFMLSTFLKLMLYLSILLIYIFLINRKDSVPFIGAFFVYYILFTIYETVYIILSSKDNNYK